MAEETANPAAGVYPTTMWTQVIEVIQKGFLLGDRVLRPARVVVSGGGS